MEDSLEEGRTWRLYAARGLAGTDLFGALVEALKDDDEAVHQAAADAVKKIDPATAAKMGIQ
jgi:hypothetical protein